MEYVTMEKEILRDEITRLQDDLAVAGQRIHELKREIASHLHTPIRHMIDNFHWKGEVDRDIHHQTQVHRVRLEPLQGELIFSDMRLTNLGQNYQHILREQMSRMVTEKMFERLTGKEELNETS